jgi:hypothetical protein
MSWFTLQLDQTLDTTTDPSKVLYRLSFTVVASQGIDRELFVANVSNDQISYVAKFRDLLVYSTNKAEAVAAGASFYRVNVYSLAYTSLQEAEDASLAIQATMQAVNREWGQGNPGQEFGGRSVSTYDSSQ